MRAIEQMSQIRVVRRFTAEAGIRLQGARNALLPGLESHPAMRVELIGRMVVEESVRRKIPGVFHHPLPDHLHIRNPIYLDGSEAGVDHEMVA